MPPSNSAYRNNENARGAVDVRTRVSEARPASREAEPVAESEFADLIAHFCPVPEGAAIAVAVSGGGDSMALALLADAWARARGRRLTALTIDHGLRPESKMEAERVGCWLGARGIGHAILPWNEPKPTTGLQEAAREARYRMIGEWARAHDVGQVLVAHQMEDQAETFLMRLARGSGITGLAAMREVIERGGVRYLRPLLSIPRARLRATLQSADQAWIEDPSNLSPRFARTGYRRLQAALADRGAGARRIAEMAQNFARLDALLNVAVRSFAGATIAFGHAGAVMDVAVWRKLPEPLALLVLRHVLAEVGGRKLRPRSDRLARAYARLMREGAAPPFTLAGCRLAPDVGVVAVRPENRPRRNRGFRTGPIGI